MSETPAGCCDSEAHPHGGKEGIQVHPQGRSGDLLADPRFSTPDERHANDEALMTEISAILAGRSAAEWEGLLIDADIGCVLADEALESEFCADHPHANANAPSVEVEHPYVGNYLFVCHVGRGRWTGSIQIVPRAGQGRA